MKLVKINHNYNLENRISNFVSWLLSASTTLTVASIYALTAPGNFAFALNRASIERPASSSQSLAKSTTEIAIIDAAVENSATLVADLPDNIPVYYLNSQQDGIEQITEILKEHQNLEAIHILGHGRAGEMNLGSGVLNNQTLTRATAKISSWSQALTMEADILLYGCNFAQGEVGQATLAKFARLTQADVAASNDYTGNSDLDGDWDLEVSQGKIEPHVAIDRFARSNYPLVLQTVANPDLPSNFCNQQVDLMFILDESGSVNNTEREQQRQSVRATLSYLVDNNINARVAIAAFTTNARTLTFSGGSKAYIDVNASTISTNGAIGALEQAIRAYGALSGATDWESGFREGLSIVTATNIDPDALFFFADGRINNGGSPDNEADSFKSNNTHIYSVGIGSAISFNDMRSLTDGATSNNYTVSNPRNPAPADHVDITNYNNLSSEFLSFFQDACRPSASLSKTFDASTIVPTEVSTLTFTVDNINGNPVRSNINFTDELPENVNIADDRASSITNTCNGTLTNSSGETIGIGDTGITLTGGSLTANQTSCQISIKVTSNRDVASSTDYVNDSDNISDGNNINFTGLSATLTVNPFPISTLAGGLIINEVLYAQTNTSAASNDEFIELYNDSDIAVNLAGLKLSDGNILATGNPDGTDENFVGSSDAYTFGGSGVTESGNTTLQPGEYAVVWIGGQNANSNAPGATFQAWLNEDPKLRNSGDDIWLYGADNSLIDYVAYGRNSTSTTGSKAINVRPNDDDTGVWSQWQNNSLDDNLNYELRLDNPSTGQSISLTPNGVDGNTSACWEKTALPAGDGESASIRCTGFLATVDLDPVAARTTSVGANNNMNSDFGDAPSEFDNNDLDRNIPSFSDPAEHRISSNLYLGSVSPDSESSPQSSNDAGGDDVTNEDNIDIDDEEGVSSFPLLRTDTTTYSLTTTVTNPNGLAANVYGWIDFDRDRQFDQDERATATSNSSGTVTLTWNINNNNSGANILNGDTYVRIRVTTDNLDQTGESTFRDDASIGLATNGEVEDYPLNIQLAPPNAQSYCESIGGTLNATNLFTEADNGTFGVGTAENQASALPANLTTYTYNPNFPPFDGEYIVSTRRTQVGFGTWHTMTGHTTGDVNDRFMIINANQEQEGTEMIQSTFIPNLTPNTNYTFTAYILNTVEIPVVDDGTADGREHIDPNVSFGIDLRGIDDNGDGTVDEPQEVEIRFSSGDIPESPQPTWIRYSFLFNTGSATEARFVLRNNKIGGFGNDLAIDDISLHGCDLPVGNLEGKLYYDNNGNDTLDSGEPGLVAGSTIRLVNNQGNNDPNDDVIVTRFASSGGDYSFLNIPQGSNYQITAPAQDEAGNPIGTTNPITGVTINTGLTTTDRNFGYDLNSKLLLVKRITAINPGKPNQVVFNGFENDPQDDNDDVANWPNKNIYLRGKTNVEDVQPGDEVEYTIYFLSDGINAVNNLSLCDVIPDNMTFVENSYGGTQGIGLGLDSNALPTEPNSLLTNANDSDLAEFYLPNSAPPTFCKKVDSATDAFVPATNLNNTNGAVVLDLEGVSLPPATTSPGTSATPTNSYGFLRFRARVK